MKNRIIGILRRPSTSLGLSACVVACYLVALVLAVAPGVGRLAYVPAIVGTLGLSVLVITVVVSGLASERHLRQAANGLEKVNTLTRDLAHQLELLGKTLIVCEERQKAAAASILASDLLLRNLAGEVNNLRSVAEKSIGVTNRSVMTTRTALSTSQDRIEEKILNEISKQSFGQLMAVQKLYRDLVLSNDEDGSVSTTAGGLTKR